MVEMNTRTKPTTLADGALKDTWHESKDEKNVLTLIGRHEKITVRKEEATAVGTEYKQEQNNVILQQQI